MEFIGKIFDSLKDLILNTLKTLFPMIRVGGSFLFWVLTAIIILPCVYVANSVYPKWEKWGEKF